MVESNTNILVLFPELPSRMATSTLFSYMCTFSESQRLLRRLNKTAGSFFESNKVYLRTVCVDFRVSQVWGRPGKMCKGDKLFSCPPELATEDVIAKCDDLRELWKDGVEFDQKLMKNWVISISHFATAKILSLHFQFKETK